MFRCPGEWVKENGVLGWYGDIEITDDNPVYGEVFDINGVKIKLDCLAARDVEPTFPFDNLDAYDFVNAFVTENSRERMVSWEEIMDMPWYRDLTDAFKESPTAKSLMNASASEKAKWWFLPEPPSE